jgi:DNA-binding NarL/FixJ family response regulator/tetratricopeptide (TPR) repeat protein
MLDRCLTELAGGVSRTVVVSGEPGIGKTALLGELAARAVGRGLTVRSVELEPGVPFEHRGPDVLILDDVHRADAGLIGDLLRRPPGAPVLLVLGYRPRQAPAALAAVLARGTAERIELGPLTAADTAELFGVGPAATRRGPGSTPNTGMGAGMSRSRHRALHEASGGNPFYLAALARSAEDPPGAELGTVDAALAGELDALPEPARRLLEAAAVAGDPFEPALVAEIAGLAEQNVLGLLDELAGADLIRPVDGSRWFRFRHPLVRHVAYGAAGAGWRWGAHGRAAAALARTGAPVEARAHHVERSARAGDDEAVAVLVAAADAALARAPGTAAHWYGAALELAPAGHECLDLRWGQARAVGRSGRVSAGRDLMHRLLADLPRQPPERRLEAVVFCAQLERVLGLHAQVRAMVDVELAALTDHDSVGAAGLKLAGAVSGMQLDQSPAAVRTVVDEVRAVASRHDDRPLEAAAGAVLAMLSIQVWERDRVAAALDRAATLVDGLTDGELADRLEAGNWLGWSELRLGRYRDALRHYDRTLRVARDTGQHHLLANLLLGRGNTLRWLGELPEAAACLQDATDAARRTGSPDLETVTLAVHSWVLILGGDPDGALTLAERAVVASRPAEGWYGALALIRRAHARLAIGDRAGVAAELVAACGGPDLPAVPQLYRAELCELLVQATLDRPAAARRWAATAERIAAELNLPGCTGFAQLARAEVLAEAGGHAAAADHALAAARTFDEVAQRLEAGRARLLAGTALAASDPARAADELSRAETLLAACHAEGLRAQAAGALRALADVPPEPTVPARLVLTPREFQVAELVSLGHTNRQVGRALTLSEKTVEGHLSRIFAKLEVPSRAALARVLAQGAEQG